jgi:hypothetical protein
MLVSCRRLASIFFEYAFFWLSTEDGSGMPSVSFGGGIPGAATKEPLCIIAGAGDRGIPTGLI